MLNAYPLNSVPLNGLPGSALPETVVIEPGDSFVWSLVIKVGGVDVSAACQGYSVSGSEDGDLVAAFTWQLGPEPVDLRSFAGRSVTIDFVVHGDPDVVERRFTGELVEPEFDVLTRLLSCQATTRLEDAFEAKEHAEIDAFVAGHWSADVFEEREGRSRWDYTLERLSTRDASLSVGRDGSPRITSWSPAGVAFEFAQGSAIYESADVALGKLSDTVNVFEIELDYRYSRYRQRNQFYSWLHPGTGGNTSFDGFMAWRADSTELPDVEMIRESTRSAGWFLRNEQFFRLPGSLPNIPLPWYNENTDLLLGAEWTASKRWAQRGVEQYRIRLEVPSGVAAVGEVIERQRVVLDTDTDGDSLWEQSGDPENTVATDFSELPLRDSDRLQLALDTIMAVGRAAILKSQRANLVTWQVPLAHALGVDFGQRLRLYDRITATGVVTSLSEQVDVDSGAAELTIGIAVSEGTVTAPSDALVVPPQPVFVDDPGPSVSPTLPTQIGWRSTAPEYDEELEGFSGNYSVPDAAGDTMERYPRRFAVPTPEIIAQWRDEVTAESAVIYRIAPPADTLEI